VMSEDYVQDPFPGMSRKEILEPGVAGVQNGIYSVDEVREKLDLPPWGIPETSEPVVFTAKGPVPMREAAEMLREQVRADLREETGKPETVESVRRQFADKVRIRLLEKLARLLLEEKGRSAEIASLRKELDL
jgi:hypothetical protein